MASTGDDLDRWLTDAVINRERLALIRRAVVWPNSNYECVPSPGYHVIWHQDHMGALVALPIRSSLDPLRWRDMSLEIVQTLQLADPEWREVLTHGYCAAPCSRNPMHPDYEGCFIMLGYRRELAYRLWCQLGFEQR